MTSLAARPPTSYAQNGDVRLAYQVVGSAPRDLVIVPGFVSHLDLFWDNPRIVAMFTRLTSFARLILFDKRGTGLSDPVEDVPTLEDRMQDVRAVMDAAGSERAAVMGISEGAPMSILFAATYPQRTDALILYGGMARSTEDEDYPWAAPADALLESAAELVMPTWGAGASLETFAPSIADDPVAREWEGRLERSGASPSMMQKMFQMFMDIDVRSVLPVVGVPTLVLHRHGDRVVNRRGARWMAEQIPGARYVELPGSDHIPWAGDADALIDEIEEFLTGARSQHDVERVLATVMFTDIVGSSEIAVRIGDAAWRALLGRHHEIIRQELSRAGGREVKTLGDGFLAVFEGPARAVDCAQRIVAGTRALDLNLRIGLHCGECEIVGSDVAGIAVHVAARIAALAAPGEILVSRTIKDLVAGSPITFVDRGVHELRGIPDDWQLLSVS